MNEQIPIGMAIVFALATFCFGCLVGAVRHTFFLEEVRNDVVLTLNNDMTVRHVVSPSSVNLSIKMADQEGTVRDLTKKEPTLVVSTIETVQSANVGAKGKTE